MKAAQIQWRHLALGLFLLTIAVLLGFGAAKFPVDKGYSILGPHVFPFVLAGFLGLLSVLLCWQAVTGGFHRLEDPQEPSPGAQQWAGAAWVSGGILAIAGLINHIGFVLAATLLFVAAARGFGSRRWLVNIAIGFALTLPVYWVFSKGLGLTLPALLPGGWI